MPPVTRRHFLCTTVSAAAGAAFGEETAPGPIIDIHQHTDYSGRTDEQLIAHQRQLGITRTVLLPAGRFFGLEASCGGNDRVMEVARRLPKEFTFFANEVPYLSDARDEIRRVLRAGGIGIGEQKFMVESDSRAIAIVAELARDFDVPVLLHFQFGRYNTSYERFERILEKFPRVRFIGHAQTFWANIDARADQATLYPKGPVTPGGLTDKFLADYPNFFGDLSAGSGLNAITRDEQHARGFFERHQNKLMFGSDCNDAVGACDACSGSQMLAAIRRLTSAEVRTKILSGNAQRCLKIAL
ncbi:MAG: amidohydrolase family protein [Chthoniobacteraceae bacterium]